MVTTIERMFVLGIDPGLTRCGYGMVCRDEATTHTFRTVAAGVLETPKQDSVERRLGMLAVDVDELLDTLSPSCVAVERIFFQSNRNSAVSVAQASGVILALAARRGIPVTQYSPNEVKQAVVGHGAATKAQVQAMVVALCGLVEAPRPVDAADALAIAMCHLTQARFGAAVAGASS